MIDIDRLKIRADLTIEKEGDLFVEYRETNGHLDVQALFSLKHRQALLTKSSKATDFINDISNRVLRAIARRLNSRLFVVYHGDDQGPPFDIHEVNTVSGTVIRVATIPYNEQAPWEEAWRLLNLL